MQEFSSENNSFLKKVDDLVDIVIIYLKEIAHKLEKDEKIYLLGKEVNATGKNYLKLLSLRNWAIKDDNNYYIIPNIEVNKEINSAIYYLQSFKSQSLVNYSVEEIEYINSINEAVKVEVEKKVSQQIEQLKKEAQAEVEEKVSQQVEQIKNEAQAKEDEKLKLFFINI